MESTDGSTSFEPVAELTGARLEFRVERRHLAHFASAVASRPGEWSYDPPACLSSGDVRDWEVALALRKAVDSMWRPARRVRVEVEDKGPYYAIALSVRDEADLYDLMETVSRCAPGVK